MSVKELEGDKEKGTVERQEMNDRILAQKSREEHFKLEAKIWQGQS